MPRQSRGPAPSARSAPARPTPTPQTRPAAPQQAPHRQASTAAHLPQQQQAPPPQQAAQGSQGPGLFGQMASTAAGVAVGSSIGHAVGGWFGGGSSQPAAAPADQPVAQQQDGQYAMNSSYNAPKVCESQVNGFKQCMDQNDGNLTICGWYLDQLKACQASASQY